MSLWNPSRPLNQPPHFRKVGEQNIVTSPLDRRSEEAALRALKGAQFERNEVLRSVGRRAVSGG